MANTIRFIPSQMDALAGTSTQAGRENPMRLMMRDAFILFKMLHLIPWIVRPFTASNEDAELYLSPQSMGDMILQMMLFALQIVFLLVAPIALVILPGGIFLAGLGFTCLLAYLIAWPLQGPRLVPSVIEEVALRAEKTNDNERWVYINGCITGNRCLQQNVNRIAKTFGRPVIGIHNNTYGLFFDLFECLVQRCLAFNTMDTRIAYDYVKAFLADSSTTKVVLIVHSQGGIIASLVLDRLFGDLPMETISKLEIYTFGSAASHFNNPFRTLPPTPAKTSPPTLSSSRCITHIEHYVNEQDMIPRWGVLYNVMEVVDNRYSGKVFVRSGASGHMFNQHYLDPIFPLDRTKGNLFLDSVVTVDEDLAGRRESAAMQGLGVMRRESDLVSWREKRKGKKGDVAVNGDNEAEERAVVSFVEEGRLIREARGKTVRQLSRLWQYIDGGSPTD